jgi:hypothetical protein
MRIRLGRRLCYQYFYHTEFEVPPTARDTEEGSKAGCGIFNEPLFVKKARSTILEVGLVDASDCICGITS